MIHGREPAGTEPLFSAEEVHAGLRMDSFWGRKVSLDALFVQQPRIHVRVKKMARQTCLLRFPFPEPETGTGDAFGCAHSPGADQRRLDSLQ